MPYPYTNDLGKQPPKPAYIKYDKPSGLKKQAEKIKVMSPEEKADAQKKMMDQLFGANPTTIKFSNVKPVNVVQDYKGLAGLYGKPDYNSTPDAPKVLYDSDPDFSSKWAKIIDAEVAKIKAETEKIKSVEYLKGSTPKLEEDSYDHTVNKLLYGTPYPLWDTVKKNAQYYKSNLLDSFGNLNAPIQKTPLKKTQGGFNEWSDTEQAFKLNMSFTVNGLENCENQKFGAMQLVSPQFIWSNPKAAEVIIDDMLRQIKVELMKKMKGGKS